MATRSTITAHLSDNTFRSIYCHFGLYPESIGKTLLTHYNTQADAEEVTPLGALSILAALAVAHEAEDLSVVASCAAYAAAYTALEVAGDEPAYAVALEASTAAGDEAALAAAAVEASRAITP